MELAIGGLSPARGLVAFYGVVAERVPEPKTVGERIAVAIVVSRLKDLEVAKLANVSAKWLGSVKTGRIKEPPADKLRSLARATGVSLRYLAEPMGWYDEVEMPDAVEAVLADPRIADEVKHAVARVLRELRR